MNASPAPDPASGPVPGPSPAPEEFSLGLQLSRASMMALTRLQLAIQSGDRRQAMEAMDRLHALDAEMERLVGRLPPPRESDGERGAQWNAIARHVSDQKLALAFDKLALVSEISGPDLVSVPHPLIRPADPHENAAAGNVDGAPGLPPFADWPPLPELEPAEWRPARGGVIALLLALLAAAALAGAAVLMTAL